MNDNEKMIVAKKIARAAQRLEVLYSDTIDFDDAFMRGLYKGYCRALADLEIPIKIENGKLLVFNSEIP